MNNIFDQSFYDFLCSTIDSCVDEIEMEHLSECKKMLVIASNARELFKKSILQIRKVNPQIQFIMVVQEGMKEYSSEYMTLKDQIITWSGKYTTELVDLLGEKIDLFSIDSFLFFSKHLLDLRDNNIFEILLKLSEVKEFSIYNIIFSGEIYLFRDLALCCKGLNVYRAMESFAEEICDRQELLKECYEEVQTQ